MYYNAPTLNNEDNKLLHLCFHVKCINLSIAQLGKQWLIKIHRRTQTYIQSPSLTQAQHKYSLIYKTFRGRCVQKYLMENGEKGKKKSQWTRRSAANHKVRLQSQTQFDATPNTMAHTHKRDSNTSVCLCQHKLQ